MKTYQDLINGNTSTIYFPIERHLAYGLERSKNLGLDLPILSPATHYGQRTINGHKTGHKYYENREDRIYNQYLTQTVRGTFYVENPQEAQILETHGWEIKIDQQERTLTNPGTGATWTTSPLNSRHLFLATN